MKRVIMLVIVMVGLAACREAPVPNATLPAPTASAPTESITAPPRIVFLRGGQVYAISADGSGETVLTTAPAVITRAALSPDGALLAFDDDLTLLNFLNLATGELFTSVLNDPLTGDLLWLPDGTLLAQVIVSVERVPQRIELLEIRPGAPPVVGAEFPLGEEGDFSAVGVLDQTHLVLRAGTTEQPAYLILNRETQATLPLPAGYTPIAVEEGRIVAARDDSAVAVMGFKPDSGLSDPLVLTPNDYSGVTFAASFSPDQTQVAVLRSPPDPAALLLAVDGSSLTVLDAGRDVSFDWLPTGLVVARLEPDGGSGLWLLPADGSTATRITDGERPFVLPLNR